METTTDKLLGGRFAVEQPAKGYRIAVDTLLLASAVDARAGQSVLELGCGVGGVMLALATRVEGIHITGVEIQAYMTDLCASNIRLNSFESRMKVMEGDIATLHEELKGAHDHVMMNPPFHDGKKHSASADPSKKMANTESEEADLGLWIAQSACALKENGTMTMIHRVDRKDEIIALATPHFDALTIKPIWSKDDGTCKRIILRAKKNADAKGVSTVAPLILYGKDGRYSDAGEEILRHAQAMEIGEGA
ncbi:MAG TPA: methyltransferase [Rhodospirillaceae bacterium]|nr:methyltransferase [Rhodospirillaceae bacterium]